jgi:thiamine biosynthesis lipoprotein
MKLTRRKFMVTAFATGLAGGAGALILNGDQQPAFVWRGSALGGEARVSLYGAGQDAAKSALDAVAGEIERLESIFSLHRTASELSQLNASGTLSTPSRDIIDLVRSAVDWRSRTSGAFDPTVQPLWQAASAGREISSETLAKAGTPIAINDQGIALALGAALTLNGIAQGRIADRVTEILAAHGFNDVVIDAGELRIPGTVRRAVGIPAAKVAITVAGVAIATSEPKSMIFDARTFRHHLIDPKTGRSPRHWESISVLAPTAEMADALSTAFAVLPHDAVADLVATIGHVAIIGADGRGRVRRFGDIDQFAGGGPA